MLFCLPASNASFLTAAPSQPFEDVDELLQRKSLWRHPVRGASLNLLDIGPID